MVGWKRARRLSLYLIYMAHAIGSEQVVGGGNGSIIEVPAVLRALDFPLDLVDLLARVARSGANCRHCNPLGELLAVCNCLSLCLRLTRLYSSTRN